MKTTLPLSSIYNPIKDGIRSGALYHIGIIMDGNRRWAEQHHCLASEGHYQGYKALKSIVEYCSRDIGLPVLTVYAFSTENWGRPAQEVDFLMKLFHQTLQAEIQGLVDNNIRLKFIGSMEGFSVHFQDTCREAEAITSENTGMLYQVALNYGGRAEILAACRRIAQDIQAGLLQPDDIDEQHIEQRLFTQSLRDPDMIIRTGGEYRLSNFLLWQTAYAEIVILEELWPDFTPDVLDKAITEFQHRKRRFGK